MLEVRAREQTGKALRSLLDLAPKIAIRVRDDGSDEEIGQDEIEEIQADADDFLLRP